MEKAQNYTEQQTTELVAQYKAGRTVPELAELMGRSTRSIVAKLSREGVYQAKTRVAAARITKAGMIVELERVLGLPVGELHTLEAVDKGTLQTLVVAVQAVVFDPKPQSAQQPTHPVATKPW